MGRADKGAKFELRRFSERHSSGLNHIRIAADGMKGLAAYDGAHL